MQQHVALQDPSTKEWTVRGQIVEEVAPRSYNIKLTDGSILRRNRIHIRKLHSTTSNNNNNNRDYTPPVMEEPDEHIESEYNSDSDTIPYDNSDNDTIPYDNSDSEDATNSQTMPVSRSGRRIHVRRPLDYEDLKLTRYNR